MTREEKEIVYRWLSFILAKDLFETLNSEDLPAITNDFLFQFLFLFFFHIFLSPKGQAQRKKGKKKEKGKIFTGATSQILSILFGIWTLCSSWELPVILILDHQEFLSFCYVI